MQGPAKGKNVIIIGGGDTGADCLGTAIRQEARSIVQLQYHPRPPLQRNTLQNPWPEVAHVFLTTPANEERGQRRFSVMTKGFSGSNGHVEYLDLVHVKRIEPKHYVYCFEEVQGTEEKIPVDLVLIATGFKGPDCDELVEELQLKTASRGIIQTGADWMTNFPGFVAADDIEAVFG